MSKIEWTDITINIHGGCTKISPGCDNCYAIPMSRRLEGMYKGTGINALKKYKDTTTSQLEWTGKVNTDISDIEKVFNKLPKTVSKKIFVCSMADLFHKYVPDEFIDDVIATIHICNNHVFQILTKRPERMKDYFNQKSLPCNGQSNKSENTNIKPPIKLPISNLHLGVTAENQAMADKRIPLLLKTPVVVRFVSVEPMLGEIDLSEYLQKPTLEKGWTKGDIDWVIIGCESGVNRRPCKLKWVRSLVDQCQNAQVPVFIKQLDIDGKVVKDWDDPLFPNYLKIRDFPNN